MFKYIVLVLVIIAAVLLWMTYDIGVSKIYSEDIAEEQSIPHVNYNDAIDIRTIKIFAVYFVPNNKEGAHDPDRLTQIGKSLQKLESFHSLQFQKQSEIDYALYPHPIIGERDSSFYDTESTDQGNPHALINIAEELERRLFAESGDLYDEDFSKKEDGVYPVLFIVYEGVGASGGILYESEFKTVDDIAKEIGVPPSIVFITDVAFIDGFFLVNREFLTLKHGAHGESIAAHEFYHTLGIPDSYEPSSPALSEDIMGLGRLRPLEKTYPSPETLSALGI